MRRLRVRLHDTTVGHLDLIGELSVFRFAPRYLTMADRPVPSRFYEDRLDPDYVDRRSQSRLPPFFEDYLPELNSPLRDLLARRAGVPVNREFLLLHALGEELPGAVVVDEVVVSSEIGDEDEVAEAGVNDAWSTLDSRPDGPLRFSLAGMQLKFSDISRT